LCVQLIIDNHKFEASKMEDLIKYLRAQVALQAESLLPKEDRRKPEVVLAKCGLANGDIAEILGKTATAVQKAVSRANAAS
jgi:DNA-directed RNA polymerase specialized sigma24 family protein